MLDGVVADHRPGPGDCPFASIALGKRRPKVSVQTLQVFPSMQNLPKCAGSGEDSVISRGLSAQPHQQNLTLPHRPERVYDLRGNGAHAVDGSKRRA
jgi:hypothetical protein